MYSIIAGSLISLVDVVDIIVLDVDVLACIYYTSTLFLCCLLRCCVCGAVFEEVWVVFCCLSADKLTGTK
jgi:hypothetical protein